MHFHTTRSFFSLIAGLAMLHATAQVIAWPAGDPTQAPLNHLQGPNVMLSNAFSQTIDPMQVGLFRDSTATVGLDSGMVICTGLYYCVIGPNNVPNGTFGGGFFGGDPDLQTMSPLYPSSIGDQGIIQLDLVPWGDTLTIRYVFASEEYDEYACSNKDDRMGLFLSGPGINGPFSNGGINMATLPISGLPVTVNTVNNGDAGQLGSIGLCGMNPGWQMDTIYYINNDFGLGTQMDGFTVVLTARAMVVPGASYHLKIAIADVNDALFDSAIFLPEGAISCSELSTGIVGSGNSTPPAMWIDPTDGDLVMKGFTDGTGQIQVEVHDPAGRLVQRTTAMGSGSLARVALDSSLRGLIVVRATQAERTITGRVVLR
ncbi:MAG: choice-of-anchor L domain-containing protein [Flavobacteriales bacterium]|nr:choice-of-anchor L domain-containing protein [Flavobacteriales bacterium]